MGCKGPSNVRNTWTKHIPGTNLSKMPSFSIQENQIIRNSLVYGDAWRRTCRSKEGTGNQLLSQPLGRRGTHILRYLGMCRSYGALLHKKSYYKHGSVFPKFLGFCMANSQKFPKFLGFHMAKWAYISRKSLKMGTLFC